MQYYFNWLIRASASYVVETRQSELGLFRLVGCNVSVWSR